MTSPDEAAKAVEPKKPGEWKHRGPMHKHDMPSVDDLLNDTEVRPGDVWTCGGCGQDFALVNWGPKAANWQGVNEGVNYGTLVHVPR